MQTKKVVAVLSDLMFTVKIQDAAKRAGLDAVFVTSQENALAQARDNPALVVLDLNYAAVEPVELFVMIVLLSEPRLFATTMVTVCAVAPVLVK